MEPSNRLATEIEGASSRSDECDQTIRRNKPALAAIYQFKNEIAVNNSGIASKSWQPRAEAADAITRTNARESVVYGTTKRRKMKNSSMLMQCVHERHLRGMVNPDGMSR
jgi:hypothetical protein